MAATETRTELRAQAYTVALLDPMSSLNGSALVLPGFEAAAETTRRKYSARPSGDAVSRFDRELELLSLEPIISVRPVELPGSVLWAIEDERAEDRARPLRDAARAAEGFAFPPPGLLKRSVIQQEAAWAFAEYIAFAPIMPVESSPLGGHALATLLTTSGGAAALVAAGNDPLLAVKAGASVGSFLILVGASRAISDGLSYRIRRWFGLPADEEPE
jgi:hypothetical protein